MNAPDYAFSRGNRLIERNTYFYTRFQGAGFLDAWRDARRRALDELGAAPGDGAESAAGAAHGNTVGVDTRALIETLAGAISRGEFSGQTRRWTDVLRKRFEVSKRVFTAYAEAHPHKPPVDAGWESLDLYIAFSALMEAAYALSGDVAYLNTLLKCNDTLVSVRHALGGVQRRRLSELLQCESDHVHALAEKLEVAL